MARKRKPGRPKGSKNKKKSKAKRSTKRKSKATPAQLRALKKAWAARRKSGKKTRKKAGKRKSKATAKQLANLAYARAVRADKKMPKTMRMAAADAIAATVRNPHGTSMPSVLLRVRRRPVANTMISKYN